MKNEFINKHESEIAGVLSTYDRIIIKGTLPTVSFVKGMAGFLLKAGVLFKDYAKYAEALTLNLRQQTIVLAASEGVTIEFVFSPKARKKDLIKRVLDQRGHAPGLVHILSAMERCPTYQYLFDKATGKSFLKQTTTKCLHYYFYFIDELLGLGYLRVPTYPPFMLQIYINGHNWLANKLDGQSLPRLFGGIPYTLEDNAFTRVSDYTAAQKTAGALDVQQLHKKFNELALKFCPPCKTFSQTCHWSIMQVEYAVLAGQNPAVVHATRPAAAGAGYGHIPRVGYTHAEQAKYQSNQFTWADSYLVFQILGGLVFMYFIINQGFPFSPVERVIMSVAIFVMIVAWGGILQSRKWAKAVEAFRLLLMGAILLTVLENHGMAGLVRLGRYCGLAVVRGFHHLAGH